MAVRSLQIIPYFTRSYPISLEVARLISSTPFQQKKDASCVNVRLYVILGQAGCGKTNYAIHLALKNYHRNRAVTLVDLDIVNPYFRSADFQRLIAERYAGSSKQEGITLLTPQYANSNLDIPALNFDLSSLLFNCQNKEKTVILDVGGEADGATLLGRYQEDINHFQAAGGNIRVCYLINRYRYPSAISDAAKQETARLREIQSVSKLAVHQIVNNSNLGTETTVGSIWDAMPFAEEIRRNMTLSIYPEAKTSLKLLAPDWLKGQHSTLDQQAEFIRRYVKLPWEQSQEES